MLPKYNLSLWSPWLIIFGGVIGIFQTWQFCTSELVTYIWKIYPLVAPIYLNTYIYSSVGGRFKDNKVNHERQIQQQQQQKW